MLEGLIKDYDLHWGITVTVSHTFMCVFMLTYLWSCAF